MSRLAGQYGLGDAATLNRCPVRYGIRLGSSTFAQSHRPSRPAALLALVRRFGHEPNGCRKLALLSRSPWPPCSRPRAAQAPARTLRGRHRAAIAPRTTRPPSAGPTRPKPLAYATANQVAMPGPCPPTAATRDCFSSRTPPGRNWAAATCSIRAPTASRRSSCGKSAAGNRGPRAASDELIHCGNGCSTTSKRNGASPSATTTSLSHGK